MVKFLFCAFVQAGGSLARLYVTLVVQAAA